MKNQLNETLNSYLESTNAQAVLLEEAKRLQTKWEASGLLEGLNERESRQMSILLENQAKQLFKEGTTTSTTAGSEEWSGVALPLVRRIFGSSIVTNEIMSVQPMNLPSGLIFYLDYQYGTTKGKFTLGQSLFGGSGNAKFGTTDKAENGFYGVGRYDYSINTVTASVAAGNITGTGSASWGEVRFDADLSASVAANEIYKIVIPNTQFPNLDVEAVRSFHITGSNIVDYYPAFTTEANDSVSFYVSGAAADAGSMGADVVVTYSVQPTDYDRGDFEVKRDKPISIPEVDLQIKSEPIVAKTRKIKAKWTQEVLQDLGAYHNVDAEEELTNTIGEYVSLEIDFENLDMILSRALTIDFWSAKVGVELNSQGAVISDSSTAAAAAYTKNSWFQTLGARIQKVSNKIHQLTMRGGANFLICSPTIATIFESIPGFSADTDGNQMEFAGGITSVGSLKSRLRIFKVPYMTEEIILVGYRGTQFLETGAVYSPYIPLMSTPVVYDPESFEPRKGLMTRYAKKMIKPEFFGLIVIRDLDHI